MNIKIREEITMHDGKFMTFSEVRYTAKSGKEGVWETVRRKTHGKIVAVFALTKNKEVLLVKQFRIPLQKYVVELPAGLADREGEDAVVLAKRELREETGYEAKGELIPILEGPFNAGMTDDRMIVFFAKDAEKIGDQMLDDAEDIEVFAVPLDSLVDFCTTEHPGFLVDMKMLNVLPVLERKGLI